MQDAYHHQHDQQATQPWGKLMLTIWLHKVSPAVVQATHKQWMYGKRGLHRHQQDANSSAWTVGLSQTREQSLPHWLFRLNCSQLVLLWFHSSASARGLKISSTSAKRNKNKNPKETNWIYIVLKRLYTNISCVYLKKGYLVNCTTFSKISLEKGQQLFVHYDQSHTNILQINEEDCAMQPPHY